MNDGDLTPGAQVHHRRLGVGTVKAPPADGTVIVRFDSGLEECWLTDLELRAGAIDRVDSDRLDDANAVIARAQAEAIRSVNQAWGVFAPSRIQLLPHQLWVCKRVLARWPTRWLIADDVGLGKTIEAGLVLWPLIARGAVRRLLVVCPASLVPQWAARMKGMFDLNLVEYHPALDRSHSDFWNANRMVVASLQTLRAVHTDKAKDRQQRLLDAEPWDLVIVDEAHHLNVEDSGETKSYRLLRELQDAGRIDSMLLFTATPHRGKHRGFFSLLELLRPDLFDARGAIGPQLPNLRQAVIRNNKQKVTDLRGTRLFDRPRVQVREFRSSDEERYFYELLTDFILDGRAYANSLGVAGQAVGLVLTALQKLAASSVTAIRAALARRLSRLEEEVGARARRIPALADEDDLDLDERARREESLPEAAADFHLVENEIPALRELLSAAEQVGKESKLRVLMDLVEGELAENAVLFFTEYKATQALFVSALMRRFGRDAVVFINGDHELRGVELEPGQVESLRMNREAASEAFNTGRARFLISTEAAGEGVDLQHRCHTVVHLDLPWNPMRIHQRNGRIYRYGQRDIVDIITLRNPETVESRIWNLLEQKMAQIEQALGEVVDDPEDLTGLVLGMTDSRTFDRIFEGATQQRPEKLATWFESESATFGGKDVVETVRSIFGNVARFDFQEVADEVPKVDLGHLEPFMKRALGLHGRRLVSDPDGTLSVRAPDDWVGRPGIRRKYTGLSFDRELGKPKHVLSAGHRLVLEAIERCASYDATVSVVTGIEAPLVAVKLRDRVTTGDAQLPAVVVGVRIDPSTGEASELLRDWEMLLELNKMSVPRAASSISRENKERLRTAVTRAVALVQARSAELDLPFERPLAEPLVSLWVNVSPA